MRRLGGERRRRRRARRESRWRWRVTRGARKPVGAAHHGVLLVDHRRDAAQRRRQHRRHGRIAAEADDDGRLDRGSMSHALQRRRSPSSVAGLGQRQRIAAADGRARNDVDRRGRKRAAVARGARVGGELDATPRARSAAASASAGNRWPPVPPAASRTRRAVARIRPGSAAQRGVAARQHFGARTLAGQRQQHAHAVGQRDHRRAAIGDERQRHALGRHQMQVHRHVDRRLQAEQHREAGDGEAARTGPRCAARGAARASR